MILGGHGITAWGATSDEAEANSRWIIETRAGVHRRRTACPSRSARSSPSVPAARGRTASEGRAHSRRTCAPIASRDHRMVGHFTDTDVVLEFLAGEKLVRARRARHVVPRSLPAHEGEAARARPARRRAASTSAWHDSASCTSSTAPTTAPTTSGTPTPDSPPMRGADPAIILVPGVGMFSYGKDKQTARVAGEFYVNAINVMRGAEAMSTYAPIAEREKFRIEYWALEEAKLQRLPEAEAPRRADRARHRRGERHRQGDRRATRRRGRLRGRRRPRRRQARRGGGRDRRRRRRGRRRRRRHRRRAGAGGDRRDRCSRSAASTSSSTTPACRSPSRCSRRPSRTGTCSTT